MVIQRDQKKKTFKDSSVEIGQTNKQIEKKVFQIILPTIFFYYFNSFSRLLFSLHFILV